jgi:hypothetical protein
MPLVILSGDEPVSHFGNGFKLDSRLCRHLPLTGQAIGGFGADDG